MEVKDKESQSEDFNINTDPKLNELTNYHELTEEIILQCKILAAEQDLILEGFRLEIELLERENVQLKASETDLERQLSYLHRQLEFNGDGDDFHFQSEDRTPYKLVSDKLVIFRNMKQLQEKNQILSNLIEDMNKLKMLKCRIELQNYVARIADYDQKWRQHAKQLQQVSNVLIESLKVENGNLRKKNVTVDAIVKSAIIRESLRNTSISELQLKVREFREGLLSFRQNYAKDYEQNSQDIKLCANRLNEMLSEARKLTKNNRKLIADVKTRQENTAIQSAQIQLLEKHNEDLRKELKIQQANSANHLLQTEQCQTATKHNDDLTEQLKHQEAKIASCLEQIEYLEKQSKTATKHNKDLIEDLATRDAQIASYLEQIQSMVTESQTTNYDDVLLDEEKAKIQQAQIDSCLEQIRVLEKQNHMTSEQNKFLNKAMTTMNQKLKNTDSHINNFILDHQTDETIIPDEISVNAFDATSKRPLKQEYFDEQPTQNKKRKVQHISSVFNENKILERSNNLNTNEILPITRKCSRVPFRNVYPESKINFSSNKYSAGGIEVPEPCREPSGESGTETRGVGSSFNLRKNLKKKRCCECTFYSTKL